MRKVFFVILLFASTIAAAQNIQNSFFGFKLDFPLPENQLSETMKEKYSRNIVFKDDDPKLIGTVYHIKFGGYEWNDANITIYKPLQRFLGVEFFQYGTLNSSCKNRYEELLATLTEKYGEPITTNIYNHAWIGKNGVNLILVYKIEPPQQTEFSSIAEAFGQQEIFDRLTLKYWDVSVEEKVKQYEKDQL